MNKLSIAVKGLDLAHKELELCYIKTLKLEHESEELQGVIKSKNNEIKSLEFVLSGIKKHSDLVSIVLLVSVVANLVLIGAILMGVK